MLALCSSSVWCWRPEHPHQDHPWPLSRLLFWVFEEVQFYYSIPVWQLTYSQNQRWSDSSLPASETRGHGLLLPTPPQQPKPHPKFGQGSVRLQWLSAAVPGRGCKWTAEPTSNGTCQWWHSSILCGRTGGLGVGVPSWPVQTGETIFEYYQGSLNVIMGRWWERLSGPHFSP